MLLLLSLFGIVSITFSIFFIIIIIIIIIVLIFVNIKYLNTSDK